jgi:hypothetical protein
VSRVWRCQNPSKAAISASAIGIRWMSDKLKRAIWKVF